MPAGIASSLQLFNLKTLQTTPILVGAAGAYGYDLMTPVGANAALGDQIDPVFSISGVTFEALDANGANPMPVVVQVNFPLDTNIDVCDGLVTGNHTDGTVNNVRVFAKVDRAAGKLDVVGLGRTVDSVTIAGYLSSEANNRATQVGFEITADETTIGTGQPIESPINIQQMTDTMAMYNIDSTVRTLEIMSTALAQSTDLEGIAFLNQRYNLGL